jgi:hypothetical protein
VDHGVFLDKGNLDGCQSTPWERFSQRRAGAYIGVAPDLLNGRLIKVARVAQKPSNVVRVLETVKHIVDEWKLGWLLAVIEHDECGTGMARSHFGAWLQRLDQLKRVPESSCEQDLRYSTYLWTLAQLLAGGMKVLDPGVVVTDAVLGDVVLEDDHIRIWDDLGLRRGEDRGSIVVNGANVEYGRGCCEQWKQWW